MKKNKIISLCMAATTGLKTTANTYIIVGEGWATEKGVVNAYATEDCGVYDYR